MHDEIYTDGYLTIEHDTLDPETPINIVLQGDSTWIDHHEAVDAVHAITKALNLEADAQSVTFEGSFNEAVLRLAAAHGRTVTFRYEKGKGQPIEVRRLVPQHVQEVGDHMTFTGYDPDRDDVRAYRVDRMKGEVSVA